MKKAFLNLTLMVLAAGLLAGCGGSDSTTSEASSSTSQAPTTTSPSTATKYKISLVYSGVSEASEYVDLNATATSAEDKKVTGNRLKVVPGTPFQVLLEASAGSTYAIGIEKQNMTGDKYCGLTTMAGTVTGDMIVTMVCKPPHKEVATSGSCTMTEPTSGFGAVMSSCTGGVPAFYSTSECQKDYSSGLIWEVKSSDPTSYRYLTKAFRDFPMAPEPQASTYLTQMNTSQLCGGEWRLPTAAEIRTLIVSTSVVPADVGRFPGEPALAFPASNTAIPLGSAAFLTTTAGAFGGGTFNTYPIHPGAAPGDVTWTDTQMAYFKVLLGNYVRLVKTAP